MTKTPLALAPALVFALAAAASAQSVPFTTFREGSQAGPRPTSGNAAIRNFQEVRQRQLGRLMPVGGSFDFNSEMLLALVMDTQSNGGVSIRLESLERKRQGGQRFLEARYRITRPAPGSLTPSVQSRPFALYRTAASGLPVRFVEVTQGGGGLLPPGQLPFHVVSAGQHAGPFVVSGQVFVKSAAELNSSGYASLVPNPGAINWNQEQLAVLVMDEQSGGGRSIAVKRVIERIAPFSPPGGAAGGVRHLEVEFETLQAAGGMTTTVMSKPFQVVRLPRGRAVFKDVSAGSGGGGLLPPNLLPFHVVASGNQPPAQLPSGEHVVRSRQELRQGGWERLVPNPQAIRWNQEMLAIILLDPKQHEGFGVEVKKVERQGPLAAQGLKVHYTLTEPTIHTARLDNRPFQIVRMPKARRVSFEKTTIKAPVRGTLQVASFGGITTAQLITPHAHYTILPISFARTLKPLDGETVTLDAEPHIFLPTLQAKGLISPAPFQGAGIVRTLGANPTLTAQGQRLQITGPLSRMLGRANGQHVDGIEGYRFDDGRLLVTKFQARARTTGAIVANGQIIAHLQPGETVTVTATAPPTRVRIERAGGGFGWVTARDLNVGAPPVSIGAPGGPMPGITGAFPHNP